MDTTYKKKPFILYPFIGAYSFIKWFFIGLISSFVFIVSTITDICIYAIKGVYHVLVTIPKDLINNSSKKISENYEKKKSQNIKDKTPNIEVNKPIAQMININNTLEIKAKDKKAIMKEKQEKYKKQLEEEKLKKKQRDKLRKQNPKLQAEKELLMTDLASGKEKRTNKPVAFRYKAIDPTGKLVKGTFTGSSKLDVNAFLVNEGYDVYSIKTSSFINFVYGQSSFGAQKMSNKDLIFWLTQLYTYVKSGIPLTDAVKILSNQMGKKGNRKKVFEKIIYELTMGSSFSDALEKQGNVFPSLLINMLKASEATGELEETLKDMADYYREIETTRKQMISAMTYPTIITVFALGVITFILMYVIPQFTKVYEQADITINGFTKSIIDFSNFLKSNISFILLITAVIFLVIFLAYKNIKFFRKNIQILLMHLPVIGKVIIYNEMTIFTKTFASLLKNNVFITESIELLSKVTNNEVYKEIMYNTITNIAKGEKISESFKDHWAIPDVAYYMIVTGESTGELAAMMDNVSTYYQEQHRAIVANLKAFIEPIMITSLAVVVGAIILAVIIPMFDLYGSISM
ncbi:MAG TPA: type II secretion system F family protein [Bacilli bacterium]|nr:type II secretion system F family protein [Bacilli bacterium]